MDMQKQEVREAVELPLTHFELYKQIGIDPPRGVLMYGPPGCGKTMLAKAVAHHTTAAFIRVVGSEFVQKYLGEGPRMVRDVFRLAKENAPAIIFIDEIDAIATKRFDAQTGGSWSPCTPLVWNQGFTTLSAPLVSTNSVTAPDIRFSSSQFSKKRPCREKAVSRTSLAVAVYA
ncbi:unnamed protein product [Schistosoma curassoni]|uniref:AAA domain-containing protein n=1 Tax=Schistosoma curassoni TaxID=6186 RepID=A0A183JRR5_9TREM|nr:unnamed protein product [Schistosoma curassoni]